MFSHDKTGRLLVKARLYFFYPGSPNFYTNKGVTCFILTAGTGYKALKMNTHVWFF